MKQIREFEARHKKLTDAQIGEIFDRLNAEGSPNRQMADWMRNGRFSEPPDIVREGIEHLNKLERGTSFPNED